MPASEEVAFTLDGCCQRHTGANSELLRVAYCEGARYVTCMIILVFRIM